MNLNELIERLVRVRETREASGSWTVWLDVSGAVGLATDVVAWLPNPADPEGGMVRIE